MQSLLLQLQPDKVNALQGSLCQGILETQQEPVQSSWMKVTDTGYCAANKLASQALSALYVFSARCCTCCHYTKFSARAVCYAQHIFLMLPS